MEYSLIGGADSLISVTPAIFLGLAPQQIEKFTPYVFPNSEIHEVSSQGEYKIEIPPFALDGYCTTKPIFIRIEYLTDGEYVSTFKEADISFSASTATEAIQELKIEIIEVYKFYKSEATLWSWPRHQLAVLEKYIVEEKIQPPKRQRSRNNCQ